MPYVVLGKFSFAVTRCSFIVVNGMYVVCCGVSILKYFFIGVDGTNVFLHFLNMCVCVVDFFDTCDASAILFKPIVQRHEGCQVLCFNYPGQANTGTIEPFCSSLYCCYH